MNEENKPLGLSSAGFLKSTIDLLKQRKEQIKSSNAQAEQTGRINDSINLYSAQFNTTDKQLQEKYNVASRGAELAGMIVDYGKDNGIEITGSNEEILNTYLRGNPDKATALYNFTHGDQDPQEFAMQMGWIKTIQEQQRYGVYDFMTKEDPGPITRALSTLIGTTVGVTKGGIEAIKRIWNNFGDIRDIANDDDKSFAEKRNQILLGEIIGDSIGGSIGDVLGGGLMGGIKGFTTPGERKVASEKIAGFIKRVAETKTGKEAIEFYNGLSEEDKAELKDYLTYLDGYFNLAGLKGASAAEPAVRRGVIGATKNASSKLLPIVNKIDDVVEKQGIKTAVKNLDKNKSTIAEIANRIGQGATTDVDNSEKALLSIIKNSDFKNIKTFSDLEKAAKKRVKDLAGKVDENLGKQTGKINMTHQNVIEVNGEPRGKYVEDAINDLLDVYDKQNSPEDIQRILDFKERFMVEGDDGVSYKELNDFSKEYGEVMDARNSRGQITTDTKQGYENTRRGIKEMLEQRVPDEEFKNLNAEMGSVINFNKLVKKSVEKVNSIEQKLAKKGLWNKTVGSAVEKIADIVDLATGRGASRWLRRVKAGAKDATVDINTIQKELPGLLKTIDKLNTQIEKAESATEVLDIIKNAEKEILALPAPKEGVVNDAGYNILQQGEDMITLPNGKTVVKDGITEIPNFQ